MSGEWIVHDGSRGCPAQSGTLLDVKYRDGTVWENVTAGALEYHDGTNYMIADAYWECHGMGNDIVEYRLHNDGWITHDLESGQMPVGGDTLVDVKLRNGDIIEGVAAGGCLWDNTCHAGDIVAYRLSKVKSEQTITEGGVIASELVLPVEKATNPKALVGASKLPMHLASPLAISYMVVALSNGAGKYGVANYKGTEVQASIYLSALLRHFMSWLEGEEYDPVDGQPHLGGILANVAILLDARAAGTLIDDRPIAGGYLKELNKLTEIYQSMQKLHADKSPFDYTLNNMDQV